MAKYDPLFEHLGKAPMGRSRCRSKRSGPLLEAYPKWAHLHSAWWANETDGRHVEAHAWMNAGRLAEHVDLNRQIVRFSAAR